MLGKIDYWVVGHLSPKGFVTKGYGFILSPCGDGSLEKFFALGSRLLFFEGQPEVGDLVCFDVSNEKPKHDTDYKLATNIRLVKKAHSQEGGEGRVS